MNARSALIVLTAARSLALTLDGLGGDRRFRRSRMPTCSPGPADCFALAHLERHRDVDHANMLPRSPSRATLRHAGLAARLQTAAVRDDDRQRQTRRITALGVGRPRARTRRERLVQPRGRGQVLRVRRVSGVSLLLVRQQLQRAGLGRRLGLRAPARTAPASPEVRPSRSSTTPPHPPSRRRPIASRTRTAGTTTRSRSPSSEPTPCPGVDSCAAPILYKGPDTEKTSLSGTCRDKAANTSQPSGLDLKYDTTPPSLARVKFEINNRGIALKWTASKDSLTFAVVRRPGLRDRSRRPSTAALPARSPIGGSPAASSTATPSRRTTRRGTAP